MATSVIVGSVEFIVFRMKSYFVMCRNLYTVLLFILLVGCQTVAKPIDKALYTILDTMDGKEGNDMSDGKLCLSYTGKSKFKKDGTKWVEIRYAARSWGEELNEEVKKRGLSCGVGQSEFFHDNSLYGDSRKLKLANLPNSVLCDVIKKSEEGKIEAVPTHVDEARKRGLPCSDSVKVAKKTDGRLETAMMKYKGHSYEALCRQATWVYENKIHFWDIDWSSSFIDGSYASLLAQDLGYTCDVGSSDVNKIACHNAVSPNSSLTKLEWAISDPQYFKAEDKHLAKVAQNNIKNAKRRGLTCGVNETSTTQTASSSSVSPSSSNDLVDIYLGTTKVSDYGQIESTSPPSTVSTAELTAAQREADRLRQELAALKAEQQQQQQTISNDTRIPIIEQLAANTSGKQGIVSGRVRDNTGIAEVTVDGAVVLVQPDGRFEHRTFIPADGKQVIIEATDLAGLTSQKQLSLSRDTAIQSASISFDSLNPLGKRVAKNRDAVALVIGVASYENTPAPAIYADSDALMFRDYASEKLGIPENRIKTLVNDTADERELLLSVKNWLARSVKQDKTDVYIFFAGHGLASDDGEKMYLLPYDGAPELLERTAILRDELFSDIAAVNPRSVTVFLDTCYSGTTRGTDMLVASRPIVIRAKQQNIPDGFTVFTAAGGDQTAKPLEEAKHGMFSYFLMKGMEGDADGNQDNQITAAELHQYVEQNVVQQSGGSQVPELQGDAGRVLVRFQ